MKISIRQLSKHFGHHLAVDIPHLEIHDGDIVGLAGNNGAGKTTLFRLMLDLLKPDNGDVEMTFNGCGTNADGMLAVNPAHSEAWKRYTGAYLDEGFLIDFLTPDEYFDFIASVCGLSTEEEERRLAAFRHFMPSGIRGQQKLIRDFSAGNKQKIGIMAAMLGRPQLLVLDEPFNYLDPTGQIQLGLLLREYCRQTGATLLLSSHDLQHTLSLATRIILLENGRMVKDLPNANGSALPQLEQYFKGCGSATDEPFVF